MPIAIRIQPVNMLAGDGGVGIDQLPRTGLVGLDLSQRLLGHDFDAVNHVLNRVGRRGRRNSDSIRLLRVDAQAVFRRCSEIWQAILGHECFS